MTETRIVNFRLPVKLIEFLEQEADRRAAELGTTQTKADVMRDTLEASERNRKRVIELEARVSDLEAKLQKATGKRPARDYRVTMKVSAAERAQIRAASAKRNVSQSDVLRGLMQTGGSAKSKKPELVIM